MPMPRSSAISEMPLGVAVQFAALAGDVSVQNQALR